MTKAPPGRGQSDQWVWNGSWLAYLSDDGHFTSSQTTYIRNHNNYCHNPIRDWNLPLISAFYFRCGVSKLEPTQPYFVIAMPCFYLVGYVPYCKEYYFALLIHCYWADKQKYIFQVERFFWFSRFHSNKTLVLRAAMHRIYWSDNQLYCTGYTACKSFWKPRFSSLQSRRCRFVIKRLPPVGLHTQPKEAPFGSMR